jgi:hypothetical protein
MASRERMGRDASNGCGPRQPVGQIGRKGYDAGIEAFVAARAKIQDVLRPAVGEVKRPSSGAFQPGSKLELNYRFQAVSRRLCRSRSSAGASPGGALPTIFASGWKLTCRSTEFRNNMLFKSGSITTYL